MSWLYYLLEANLYLILFYGFYRLFLHKETFYGLNRYYLIFSSVLAFILPFFQLGFLKTPVIAEVIIEPTVAINQVRFTDNLPLENYQPSIFTVDHFIIAIYVLVTVAFLFKMFFGLSKIIRMLKLPSIKLENGVKLIDLKDSKIAFSFFNLLFLDPALPEKNTILKHELVHIKQKHSLDVLLFEIIQVINWFNPISYLVKKDIKLIHEYLADEETTRYDVEKYHYAMFLIQNSTGIQNLTLTNQIFSSSILKKRISMLNQKKSARWTRLKLLLVLPITAGILCISTAAFTKDYGFVDLLPQKTVLQDTVKQIKRLPPPIVKADNQTSVSRSNALSKKAKKLPPPIVKPDQIKFAPPIVIPDEQTSFYPKREYSGKTHKPTKYEKRYIMINGQPVDDNETFYGVRNTKSVKYLSQLEAIKKYGKEKGKNGAIEITGDNIQYTPKISPPPPANEDDNKLKKVILLPPPPPIKNKDANNIVYHVDVDLDRSKGDKLIAPESEKGKKSISIYSDRGEKVYISPDYKNDWDGKLNAFSKKTLIAGSYSYEITIPQSNGEKNKVIRGYISIK
jgi:beta-lactamase regulating signal transducer with metallopeptidase domain